MYNSPSTTLDATIYYRFSVGSTTFKLKDTNDSSFLCRLRKTITKISTLESRQIKM